MQLNTYAVSVSVFIVSEWMGAAWILKFLQPDMYKLLCMAYCWLCRHSLLGDILTSCNDRQSAPEDPVVFRHDRGCRTLSTIFQPNPFGDGRFGVASSAFFHKQAWLFHSFICCCKLSDVGGRFSFLWPF